MKTKTLIIIAIIFVSVTLLGNWATLYFNLQDTSGVEEGMTLAEFTAKIPQDERVDFWNYSFFANNHGFPVLIRFEEEIIVDVEVVDATKTSIKQSKFEKITPGMTFSQVFQLVGKPYGYSKIDDMTLVYVSRNDMQYMISFTMKDQVLYVQGVTSESIG